MNELDDRKKTADFLASLEEEDHQPKDKKNNPLPPPSPPEEKPPQSRSGKLTQGQRFLVSFLVFLMVLILGFFVMLITGKMVLPL